MIEAARLQPLLALELRLVVVGTRPGRESLRVGCYYANPENTFWADLHASGLVPRLLEPCAHASLLDFGIGLDDVYDEPSRLRARILAAAPQAVCFNSKEALAKTAGVDIGSPWQGAAASAWIQLGSSLTWAVPDSSPRAARWHSTRVKLLGELSTRLAEKTTGNHGVSDG